MSDYVDSGTNADGYTRYGMRWGPIEVTRMTELPEGRRVVGLQTPRARLHVYVTRTGLLRVFRPDGVELKAAVSQHTEATQQETAA